MGEDKLWSDVGGRPLLALTLDAVAWADCFDTVVVAAPRSRWQEITALAQRSGLRNVQLVEGGARRQDSVAAALALCADSEVVCVHDAARPLVPPQLFRDVLAAARESGAATAGVASIDTVKQVADGHVVATLPRDELIATQTPQAFRTELLVRAHREAGEQRYAADDDASLVEHLGAPVTVVPGDSCNLKVTTPQDLLVVRALFAGNA